MNNNSCFIFIGNIQSYSWMIGKNRLISCFFGICQIHEIWFVALMPQFQGISSGDIPYLHTIHDDHPFHWYIMRLHRPDLWCQVVRDRIPSRHHGFQYKLKWSSVTWMIWGYPHDWGNLHISDVKRGMSKYVKMRNLVVNELLKAFLAKNLFKFQKFTEDSTWTGEMATLRNLGTFGRLGLFQELVTHSEETSWVVSSQEFWDITYAHMEFSWNEGTPRTLDG